MTEQILETLNAVRIMMKNRDRDDREELLYGAVQQCVETLEQRAADHVPDVAQPTRETIARIIDGVPFRPVNIDGPFESETTKEHFLRRRNSAYYKADQILAAQPPAAPVETIDSVPSCGQENDYRRAQPVQRLSAGNAGELDATERGYLEDNIATVAHHLGQPGAFLSVHYDGGAKLLVDPGEVLKEISRRLSDQPQRERK